MYTLFIVIYGVWLYSLILSRGYFEFGFIFLAFFTTIISFLIIACIKGIIWRVENGVDLFATLETDPEKVKEHILFIMQYHGFEENLKELNDIFRNYPQWEFDKWEVFRAWYKEQIDYMVKKPDIYRLTMKDGSPYDKDKDPLYDPNAPDWEQYDPENQKKQIDPIEIVIE